MHGVHAKKPDMGLTPENVYLSKLWLKDILPPTHFSYRHKQNLRKISEFPQDFVIVFVLLEQSKEI